ncbi:MAG: response regulator [Chloroflexi bacterium]|nr:MAG: response regulator [Chloroflexota bacterium]
MDNPGTVLIVDDQISAREVLTGLLIGENYNLVFAENGHEALQKAAKLLPDAILLDVMMPGMDGFEVCRRLRADEKLAETPILMVTSLDDRDSRLQGLEAGADDFIAKPFNRAELRARVRTVTRLNIHRRLRAQELQAERDRTQAILEALGEAVVVTDANGVIEYMNPAAAHLTGYRLSEARGQSWQIWQSAEAQADLYAEIIDVVRAGKTWRGEVTHRRKDGHLYDASLTVAPLFAPDAQTVPAGFVSVQRDISPLKQAERSKNEFVSNVSHELRTPLSVITLLSDNLESLYDRLPDERRLKMIRDIQKHTQVLNDLIGDVLEISRIDSGRISMERSRLDLSKLVREQTRELSPLVQQKLQTLQVLGRGQLPVNGHSAQLKQVIRNLLTNAIKYTPDGGQIICQFRALMAPAPATDEWPGCDRLAPGPWVALRVSDTGVGIAPEHIDHLFERFYRVQSEQKIRGTGLGLSIARELVELHGGTIAVHSVPGHGSTFAVYLPPANPEAVLG